MDKYDILISIRRTLVPIIVGAISGTLLGKEVGQEALVAFISGAISTVYYVFWRVLETRLPNAGFFLGARKIPVYLDNAS